MVVMGVKRAVLTVRTGHKMGLTGRKKPGQRVGSPRCVRKGAEARVDGCVPGKASKLERAGPSTRLPGSRLLVTGHNQPVQSLSTVLPDRK